MNHLADDLIDDGTAQEIKKAHERRLSQQKEDVRFLLNSPQGRRFIWRLIGHCKVFESIFHSSSLISYNAGKQDVGHFLMSEVINTDETALIKMMQESKEGNK